MKLAEDRVDLPFDPYAWPAGLKYHVAFASQIKPTITRSSGVS
jgi:hypothetical protein